MTRGKHGNRAQARADQVALDKIREVEAALATEREARQTRVALQRARDGVAGELIAAKRDAANQATQALREQLDAANAEIRERKKMLQLVGESQYRLGDAWKRALKAAGLTAVEAHEKMLALMRYAVHGDWVVDIRDLPAATYDSEERRLFGGRDLDHLSPEEVGKLKQYQAAKGLRHHEAVAEQVS